MDPEFGRSYTAVLSKEKFGETWSDPETASARGWRRCCLRGKSVVAAMHDGEGERMENLIEIGSLARMVRSKEKLGRVRLVLA